MQRKRKKRPPELTRSKGGYDSGFERKLHSTVLKHWQHHGDQVSYVVEHNYEPDFVRKFDDQIILIPALPMPMAKKRKDGTKRSHSEWAESRKFRWYTADTLPNEWRSND